MKSAARIFTILLIAAATLFALGCPDRTSIADIEHNPSKHINKEVVVAGVVKDSYGVSLPGTNIRGGIYKVDDGTGSIWVVTENTAQGRVDKQGHFFWIYDGATNSPLACPDLDRSIQYRIDPKTGNVTRMVYLGSKMVDTKVLGRVQAKQDNPTQAPYYEFQGVRVNAETSNNQPTQAPVSTPANP